MTTKTTTTTDDTTTQQRAICAACFAQQAIRKSGNLVPHGYTRPQHWNANVGTCTGAGEAHFGTEAGRDYTASLATRLRRGAEAVDADAAQVIAGTSAVLRRERLKNTRVYHMVAVDNPTPQQRAAYAASLASTAAAMRAQAVELDARVNGWTPAAPITVGVAKKETLRHWRGGYYRGKACASSAMGAMKGYTTSNIEEVTCAKCRERHARAMQTQQAAAR